MSDDPETAEVLDLLADPYARALLRETRTDPMSARELSDACNISVSTVYRRADRLVECGLLAERRVPQPDGNHFTMYEARLDELTIRLAEDGFDARISERATGTLADRFTDMWEGL